MRRETFRTAGPPRLRVHLPAGEVQLETADTAETSVELEGPREDDALIAQRGDEVVVEVERRKLLGKSEHRLAIRAPHGAVVEAHTTSADLEGRGRFGAVSVHTASGDLRLEEVESADLHAASGDVRVGRAAGDARVQTASGDVELGSVGGQAIVRSASGDVTVGQAEASVTVQTASGDQRIGSVARGEVRLQSASGDLEIGVRRGSRVRVDVRSMSGETASEVELSDAPPPGGEGPLVELRATSISGDIRIRRG